MNNFTLQHFLTTNTGLDEATLQQYLQHTTIKTFAKGDMLLRQGDICRHSFYVEKGLLRYYSIDEKGKEHILQFAPERWLVTDRESVYFNQPTDFFIDTLEPSQVAILPNDFFADLSAENKTFLEFNEKLLHNHIRHLQRRINLLLSASAEERYLDFISHYPDLLLRVPQWMIASYLGITPESLSRVRKDLAAKNYK
jgi:CRP-like cAMP-binding protein